MQTLLLLSLLVLCAVEPTTALAESSAGALQKEVDDANAGLIDLIRSRLVDFLRESRPTCNSMNLSKSSAYALNLVKLVEGGEIQLSAPHEFDLGTTIVDIADAAQKVGCQKEALDLYRCITTSFLGSNHAPIRERAEVGMQELSMR